MDDSGEIYDGVRAEFPLSFGKQSKSQTPLETIHKATRRPSVPTSNSKTPNDDDFPSKEWLHSIRPPKNPNPPSPPQDDYSPLVGPPPPPPRHEADEEEDDDDAEMIGPPPPPPGSNFDDSEDEDNHSDQDQLGNRFRIPLSNEIVLKGHTKVLSFFLCFFRIRILICTLLIIYKLFS